MNKDLTVGKPGAVLRDFCVPLLGSIIFQQLYNIADSLVAGKFIGENALAAVGNSYEITLIFIAFAFGCNMGCSVVVSQLYGAKDYKGVKTAVYTASIFSALICGGLMVLGVTSAGWLLGLIRTPQEVFWRYPPSPILRWISSSSVFFTWVWPVWPGPPSCARALAACWPSLW